MAESSSGRNPLGPVKVWTFLIRGGAPFSLMFPRDSGVLCPPLEYKGRRLLWKMAGTEEMAHHVETAIREASGCQVERHTEEQTPEQAQERLTGPSEE